VIRQLPHKGFEMSKAAYEIQAARTRDEYDRAKDNIEWLSDQSPVYACGERVAKHDVHKLLGLNHRVVEYIETNCRHHLSLSGGGDLGHFHENTTVRR
jgi:hypothetical protein